MKKLEYLRIKWNDPTLTQKKLIKYNADLMSLFWRIVRVEIKIEAYLYKSLNEYDWSNGIPFAKKMIKKIEGHVYGVTKKELKQADVVNHLIKKATLGTKILLWKSLRSNEFSDKNKIFKCIKDGEITDILENTRDLRNSIAHYESIQSWSKKMRQIDGEKNLKKIISATMKRWGV